MNYLQEKVPVATQTFLEEIAPQTASGGRNIKTAMSMSALPPLIQQQMKSKSTPTSRPDTTGMLFMQNIIFYLDLVIQLILVKDSCPFDERPTTTTSRILRQNVL